MQITSLAEIYRGVFGCNAVLIDHAVKNCYKLLFFIWSIKHQLPSDYIAVFIYLRAVAVEHITELMQYTQLEWKLIPKNAVTLYLIIWNTDITWLLKLVCFGGKWSTPHYYVTTLSKVTKVTFKVWQQFHWLRWIHIYSTYDKAL